MNVFTKMKDKIKDFFSEMTTASKLKYAVVAVILLVAVAAVAVVGTAGNEEAPEATLSTESLTIQFDEEIVINFDEETDEDEPSSVEENADVTETDPAEETSAVESEKDTKAESTEAETSESTTDKQSAPSEETAPAADAPEETKAPAAQTPVTEKPQAQAPVTQKPVTQKPATQAPATQAPVTQAPATQAPATQAPATQAPATQAPVTQAPVTQAPATQKPVTQKPAEEPEETKNHGNWVVKQKKYYYDTAPYVIYFKGMDDIYNGPTTPGNVMILNIENKSDEAYTITIKAKYLDSAGNVIGTEDRNFEGFAANWSNYFVFAPGYEFDKFTFDFSAKKYNAETYVQYFKVYEECGIGTHMALDGGNGRESYSVNDEGFDAMKKLIAVDGYVRGGYTGTGIVDYTGTIVLFDKNGDLAYIRTRGKGNVTGSPEVGQGGPNSSLFLTDIPYSEVDSYKIPDNLTSVSGFYAIETFSRK